MLLFIIRACFRATMDSLLRKLRDSILAAEERSTFNILCYCRRGRHRSVGWAEILTLLFQHAGLQPKIYHYGATQWYQMSSRRVQSSFISCVNMFSWARVYVCMYGCMYVCTYVRTYALSYVCPYVLFAPMMLFSSSNSLCNEMLPLIICIL